MNIGKTVTKIVSTLILLVIAFLLAQPSNAIFSATPINDLGANTYLGFVGGLYPNGENEMPETHAQVGSEREAAIQPLNTSGAPDPSGKIVLLSVGMSNTRQEFCGQTGTGTNCDSWSFVGQALADPEVNHDTLVIVNGAQGGKTANYWVSPTNGVYNNIRDDFLIPNGLSEAQVQAIWLKNANANPTISLPNTNSDAYALMGYFGSTMRALKIRYPNLQQVFLSSRIYAGYATKPLNPEPYAYESGFAVKWLIEAQINQMETGSIDPTVGDLNYNTVAPWISWGPYNWADGTNPRSDGLTWVVADFENDKTHPSTSGETKVGTLILNFFKNSPLTQSWFLDPVNTGYPTAVAAATPTIGVAPLSVSFDASQSSDDGTIVSYFWDFGDGNTSTVINPTHIFSNPGLYTVNLTVTDDSGLNGYDSVNIQVDNPPTSCTFHCLRVTGISFTIAPQAGGLYKITSNVILKDENGTPVPNSTIAATWTLPDASNLNQSKTTNSTGLARFTATSTAGTYTLVTDNATLAGYTFDPDNSVLTGTVTAP